MKSWFGAISTVAMAGFLGLALWSSYGVLVLNRTDLYAENGLIENTQVILLLIACLAFFAPIALEARSDKLILLFYSLLCYIFILREVEVQEFNIPEVLIFMWSGVGRNIIGTVAFTTIVCYALFHFTYYKNAAVDFLTSRPGSLVLLGGGFLFLGDFLEKNKVLIHYEYFEEIFELLGYVFILLAACAVNSCVTYQTCLRSLAGPRSKPTSPEREVFRYPLIQRPRARDAVDPGRVHDHGSLIVSHDLDFEALFALTRSVGSRVIQECTQDGFPDCTREALAKALDEYQDHVDQDVPLPLDKSRR